MFFLIYLLILSIHFFIDPSVFDDTDIIILWTYLAIIIFQGSTVARQASDKERAKGLPTYKDNDFLNDARLIQVGEEKRKKLMEMIQADTEVGQDDGVRHLIMLWT